MVCKYDINIRRHLGKNFREDSPSFLTISSPPPHFTDKPSQPGEIEIISIFKDSITLEWERPECDGGKDIIGYWIEYRQYGQTAWKKCNKERIKDRQFMVGGLLEATEYEFRVFAENETGISRPRRTAMTVKTKLTCKICSFYFMV